MNSPALKAFSVERIGAGEKCLVVDLDACTGMDSTFMGTLAGIATRVTAGGSGVLQIANAGTRNRRSLEDLGLDFLMDIDPVDAAWLESIDAIRTQLDPPLPPGAQGPLQQTKHVLEAHQILADTNEKNQKTFSTVVSLLGAELESKEKLAGKPKEK